MPGFNQRGPMNQGPMTGRGQGVCTGSRNPGMGYGGMGYGMGMGRRRGRRGFNPGAGPQGWGMGYGQNFQAAPMVDSHEILKNREAMLEQELAAIKDQIRNLSDTDA